MMNMKVYTWSVMTFDDVLLICMLKLMKEETYVLNGWFNLWEQVDKLDVGWEYEAARGGTTKVVLGV